MTLASHSPSHAPTASVRGLASFFIISLAVAACGQTAENQFSALKTMVGDWAIVDEAGNVSKTVDFTYRLTGGGSALVETLFCGTPHEMVTVYHMDGDDLLLTHYCSAGNQPRMKAVPARDGSKIEFEFLDGTNMDPATDGHMHKAIVQPGRIRSKCTWSMIQAGEELEAAVFTLQRLPPAAAVATPAAPATAGAAATPTTAAKTYAIYGEGVQEGDSVAVAAALADPAAIAGKTIRLEGDIAGVCKVKGCWMRMGSDDSNVLVRFEDYGFFVPTDTPAGKHAIVEGVLSVEEQSVADQQHYLEDAGKHDEAKLVTEPKQVIGFMATGVKLEK